MTTLKTFRNSRGVLRRPGALIAVAVLLLASSPPAFAYLDPSTGSMVVSAIVGIFASIALAVKTYWYKIKGFFRKSRAEDASTRETPE